MIEDAKPIPSLPGFLITASGDVYDARPRRLTQTTAGPRYAAVRCQFGRKFVPVYLHRVLMEAFGPPRPSRLHIVAFIDGDRRNVALDNLTWRTRAELSAVIAAKQSRAHQGIKNPKAKLDAAQVRQIRKRSAAGERRSVLAKDYGVSLCTIDQICSGKTWKHLLPKDVVTSEGVGVGGNFS